jgi:hypothetical protein
LLILASIAEGASAIDSIATQVIFAGSIEEFVSGVDSNLAIKTVNAYPTGIQLLVSIGGVLVWAVIDDSQNANWQNISNVQTAGWQDISNAQTPGWQVIGNVQTPGWQNIDDEQAPGWINLPS